MTEESKKTLLDYFTGKLKKKNKNQDEITKEVNEILYDNFSEHLPENLRNIYIYGLVNSSNDNVFVFYGYWERLVNNVSVSSGILILTDTDFQVLKVFTKYNDNTDLRCIYNLQQAEDRTFYGIDGMDVLSKQDLNMRLILLNDFTKFYSQINDYFLDFRKSYILPDQYQNAEYLCLTKNPNSSQYVLAGQKYNHYGNIADTYPIVLDFKINVGSTNEWNSYIPSNPETKKIQFIDIYIELDTDNQIAFEILGHNSSEQKIILMSKELSSSNLNLKTVMQYENEFFDFNNFYISNQTIFKNKNELFFSICDRNEGIIFLYRYDIENSKLDEVYHEKTGLWGYGVNSCMFLCKNENDIYILYLKGLEHGQYSSSYNMYYFRYNGSWNPILLDKVYYTSTYQNILLFSTSKFNMLQLCILDKRLRSLITIKEDYNSTNYNSSSYINQNSLIPKKVELFNDKSFIFARNLYNKSINNNTTISTFEVPNTFLNNTMICLSSLLSDTNLELIKSNKRIEKNIYETVYLNFINSLMISNENDPNSKVLNQEGSTYLNYAINDENAYDNAKLYNKAIIKYNDETSKEIEYKIDNVSETACKIKFNLYIDKKANSIDFISNDKTTVYHTIDISNLELNKYYKINQNLEVV